MSRAAIEALRKWLSAKRAMFFWSRQFTGFSIEMYALNNHTFLVQTYDDGGFEIFIPASKTNNIERTLEAVEAYAKD